MTKTAYYCRLAEESAVRITQDPDEWKGFLTTSGRLYKYSYEDQLMIYAQRPDATACAEYDLWNQTMRRYVKRGAKGIALIDNSGDYPRLRYVFDISDTGERATSRPVPYWHMSNEEEPFVMAALEDRYHVPVNTGYIEDQMQVISQDLAARYWNDFGDRILGIIDGSYLEDYDEFGIGSAFRKAASASILYQLISRVHGDAEGFLDTSMFDEVRNFNTRQTAAALGRAVSTLSSAVLREIGTAIRRYEREKAQEEERFRNMIFIEPEEPQLRPQEPAADRIQTQKQEQAQAEEPERSAHENNDRDHVHAERGLPDSGHSDDGNRAEAAEPVREDAEDLASGEQSGSVQRPGADGAAVPAPVGDSGDSAVPDGAADDAASGGEPGTGQEDGPDGLGAAYEHAAGAGGGDRDSGTYQQLSLFPTEAEQIAKIDSLRPVKAKAESEKPSALFMSEENIERVLKRGSGFQDGKIRITKLYTQENDPKTRAAALKKEYGIGGWSWTFLDGGRGMVDHSAKGIEIRRYGQEEKYRLTWTEVEKRIRRLVQENRYLTPEERARYEAQGELDPIRDAAPVQNELPLFSQEFQTSAKDPEVRNVSERTSGETPLKEVTGEAAPAEPVSGNEPAVPARNFRITDDHLGEGGPKQKFRMNMDAIHLLKTLEAEDRDAVPEEQEVLSRYVGWGGLADAFDESKASWASEYQELRSALTDEEYEAARASTLNAHYTSPTVIRAIYEAVERMGFETGNILEPSMGVGNFFGMLPEAMQGSRLYGVELDSISGRIARKLYPEAEVTVAGFETTDRRDFYDLAVGNVPFGNYRVADKPYDRLGFSIHNYFFAKALDQVRPGGLIAFVTSRYTLDSKNPEARQYLAQRAEFLGAIRLPNNAFKANAGTEVVSDIIFLKKRDHPIDISPDWVHLGLTGDGFAVNSYFVDHPEMVLGTITAGSTQYGREDLTVAPFERADPEELLSHAIRNIDGTYEPQELAAEPDLTRQGGTIPADPTVRNYSFTLVDGEIYYRENSIMRHVTLSETAAGRVRGMVGLRGITDDLIRYQLEDFPEDAIREKQRELNTAYDDFTKTYGLINSRANAQAFTDDSSYYLLCSLENLDENGKLESKADMFTQRTIRPERTVTSVDTPAEALVVSIGERGKVDLPFMAQLLGTPDQYDTIIGELQGVIFRDPVTDEGMYSDHNSDPYTGSHAWHLGWQTADEYLSGNVREKLRIARAAADRDPRYQINAEALAKAQPKDLDASEIDVRLGATWIGRDDIRQFMLDVFDMPFYLRYSIDVNYSEMTAEWQISGKSSPSRNDVNAYVKYGTGRANAYRILEDTLNLRDIRIYDTVEDAEGKSKRVLNKKETTLAQQKQQAIKDAFKDWVWKDPYRRERLVKRYNELFNSTRPREYDGSHIRFGGMNPEITLREHQRNAIAHVLYGGNTLLAHEVGAGKTFEMAAAAMEAKRLGLCQKSLFVVPNHLTLQWANEFLRLYPSAKLLVASKKDFETANRKKFCARIATGDYDAVIIGHSQFEKIPISAKRQERLLREEIDGIEEAIAQLKHQRGERFSVKQMEKSRRSLQTKLAKLQAGEKKDDVITFEQLGVDRLFIDEAQAFKNCFLYTKMRNVAGLSTAESQKSADMLMKCRYMDEITGGRGVIFATGTPVSNSMTELYTMMRYLQWDTLKEKGLSHFDCWASTFGETTTAIELAPEGTGYRARTRFAKFFNLPELMNMFKEVADIKTSDQLQLPVPEARFETVVVQPSEFQKEMVAELSERAGAVHAGMVDPSKDNMLKITSDGRKIGLDQRLMNPLLPDDPESKLNACVRNALRIYEEGTELKLTQLLFCDMSTPKTDGTFSVYDDIRSKLLAGGVPESEVAFIHTADTEAKKKELFAKVRTGQVRILLGSTQKMGAGTNVQDRLIAVHHLDVGWRPADMTQRNGRIIRQGNRNPEVQIYNYVTNGTFDAYLFQTLENKQRFISQIMTSKSPVRSCEDVDEQALSYAEIKALCAGDPNIREKMDLDVEVARLKVLKADHLSQQYRLEDRLLKYFPAEIERQKGSISGYKADVKTAEGHPVPEEGFAGMEIRGVMYEDKAEAGKAIVAACRDCRIGETMPLGSYRGFHLDLTFDGLSKEFQLSLRGSMTHRIALGTSAQGNMIRIDNAIASLPEKLEKAQQRLEELYAQQESTRAEVGKPFPQEAELASKSARLAELDALLNMDVSGGLEFLPGEGDDLSDDGEDEPGGSEHGTPGMRTAYRPGMGYASAAGDTTSVRDGNSSFYGDEEGSRPSRSSVLADLRSRSETVPPQGGPEKGVAI